MFSKLKMKKKFFHLFEPIFTHDFVEGHNARHNVYNMVINSNDQKHFFLLETDGIVLLPVYFGHVSCFPSSTGN